MLAGTFSDSRRVLGAGRGVRGASCPMGPLPGCWGGWSSLCGPGWRGSLPGVGQDYPHPQGGPPAAPNPPDPGVCSRSSSTPTQQESVREGVGASPEGRAGPPLAGYPHPTGPAWSWPPGGIGQRPPGRPGRPHLGGSETRARSLAGLGCGVQGRAPVGSGSWCSGPSFGSHGWSLWPQRASVSPSAPWSVGEMELPPSLPTGVLRLTAGESCCLTFPERAGQAGGMAGAAGVSWSSWDLPGSPHRRAFGLHRPRSGWTKPPAEASVGI